MRSPFHAACMRGHLITSIMNDTLIQLRHVMADAGISVYIIPSDDYHGSEYVGDYFKCRAFVSGFTGSAGTLIVSDSWAGLWTDGRYFLQGAQQLAGSGIDLMRSGEKDVPTIEAWLADHLSEGDTLGFDGRCMTARSAFPLEKIIRDAGASICYDVDLVDKIWHNRPPMPSAPAWELENAYTGRSRADKIRSLRSTLQDLSVDVFVLSSLDDISWLLNLRGNDIACVPVVLANMIISQSDIRLFSDSNKYTPELQDALAHDGVTICPYFDFYDALSLLPAQSSVLLDNTKVNYAALQRLPASVHLTVASNPTEAEKAVKNDVECENMRQAHIKDGIALVRFMKWLKSPDRPSDVTEISAASTLEAFREAQPHYVGPSFDPIIAFGCHGAIVHYSATLETDSVIGSNNLLLADTGGHYLEGTTDVTRTFALGSVTTEMKHLYTLVLRGNLALGSLVFPAGCGGINLDTVARRPLWEEGLDYNHGTGHGVGYLLSVHEGPQSIRCRVTRDHNESIAFKPGMITSNEPGIYLEDKFGIRLENLCLCVEMQKTAFGTFLGFETLTMCPFDLDAIAVEELSAEERTRLNAYHERVYQTLRRYLTEDETLWLRDATRPV